MSQPGGIVEVEIFGRIYKVRGGANPEGIRELAAYVDQKMQEVEKHTNTVDTMKVAILAALNIADEFYRFRTQHEQQNFNLDLEKCQLLAMIDAALEAD